MFISLLFCFIMGQNPTCKVIKAPDLAKKILIRADTDPQPCFFVSEIYLWGEGGRGGRGGLPIVYPHLFTLSADTV